ncbi:MAG TPA: carboxypeptidase-like regulatory domain-containing protein [Anaeromyxobacter sp.]
MLTVNVTLLLATLSSGLPPLAVPLPPGELRGQVTGRDGRAVASFTVNGVAFAGPEGRFKVLTPPEGEFRVVIRAAGYAPNVFQVQGASGKKLAVPEIRLGGGEHLLGEVLDAETEMPVVQARAALADPAKIERLRFVRPEIVAPIAVAGSGGWYEIRRAPRGLLVLVVSAPGYLPEFVQVNTRQPLPSVRLHRGGTVAGVVRDAAGQPLPGAKVVAVSPEALDAAEVTADAKGIFSLPKLRAGRYQVLARAAGRSADGGEVAVEDDAVSAVTVRVPAPASLALAH